MGISYLLDTHVLLWWFFDDPRLEETCRELIRHPDYRMIMAQGELENIPIITYDKAFQTGLN